MVKWPLNYWRNHMANSGLKSVRVKISGDLPTRVANPEVTNMLLYKTLNKMEYFRSRCVEMEEKHGLDFSRFKDRIDSGEEGKFDDWDELMLWEEYFNSFREWKSKYEELNCFLK
jgi:hypothetical protein